MSKLPDNCGKCGYMNGTECEHECGRDIRATHTLLPKFCPLKTEVLDSKRFCVVYRGENLYLLVALLDGMPWEIFVEHATNGEEELKYMLASWDCNTRFISESLQNKPLVHVVKQLRRSSRKKDDLPGILAEKLEIWL